MHHQQWYWTVIIIAITSLTMHDIFGSCRIFCSKINILLVDITSIASYTTGSARGRCAIIGCCHRQGVVAVAGPLSPLPTCWC